MQGASVCGRKSPKVNIRHDFESEGHVIFFGPIEIYIFSHVTRYTRLVNDIPPKT